MRGGTRLLVGILALTNGWVASAQSSAGNAQRFARRVEILGRSVVLDPLDKPLEPGRVYVVWSETLKRKVFVLSDGNGRLSRPLQALSPGTVVSHEAVAGETGRRYRLSSKGRWEPTDATLQRRVYELGDKPQYRVFFSSKRR